MLCAADVDVDVECCVLLISLLVSFPFDTLMYLQSKTKPAEAAAPEPLPPAEIKVGKFADVAPAARDGKDANKFGAKPANVMDKEQRPEDFRLKHDPKYPFGRDASEVGEADQLQVRVDSCCPLLGA
jgi:hypothetical protein